MVVEPVMTLTSFIAPHNTAAFFIFTYIDVLQTVVSAAKRHLLSEDVIKIQDFQEKKLTVAHLATGSKGKAVFALALSCSKLSHVIIQTFFVCFFSPIFF